jgi:hypothetical protein
VELVTQQLEALSALGGPLRGGEGTDTPSSSSEEREFSPLRAIFWRFHDSGTQLRTYDVSPNGERFLMIKEGGASDETPPAELILVQNWFEELKRLVPTN